MKFRELLLEIKNLGVYSAEEWEAYLRVFSHNEALEQYLSQQPRLASRLSGRIKSMRGADAAEPDYALSTKVMRADSLHAPEIRDGIAFGVASGSFDLLHLGHVKGLAYAKAFLARDPNSKLCAMTLSDESIRAKKGPSRPILNLNERLDMLCHTQCVDYVIPLEEPDCLATLDRLRPEFFFKDGVDRAQLIVRREIDLVESYGGAVIIFPPECDSGISTTGLIETIMTR